MKRRIVSYCLMALLLIPSMSLMAQRPDDPMSKGNMTLGFGIGPGTEYMGHGYGGFGPGFKIFFEAGMWKLGPGTLTLGAEYGFSYFTSKPYPDYKYHVTNMMFAVRSAYHYGFNVPGLDCYAGIPLGFGFSTWNYDNYDGRSNEVEVFPYGGIFFGTSFYFNDVVGINGEFGYNVTYANIGVIFRLK